MVLFLYCFYFDWCQKTKNIHILNYCFFGFQIFHYVNFSFPGPSPLMFPNLDIDQSFVP